MPAGVIETMWRTVAFLSCIWLAFQHALPAASAVPAAPCSPALCRLPDCQCASRSIPGGLSWGQTPQIVTISFDDAIRVQDYQRFYSRILRHSSGRRTNRNGCPVPLTFFTSHYDTDYSLAAELVSQGHELAVHSVTHRTPSGFWAGDDNNREELTREIVDMRTILKRWARVPDGGVAGYRTPFLASSEDQLRILHENDFLYDCTMVTNEMYWPFTLDYKSPICSAPAVCPNEALPGLWVIPNINKAQNSSFSCSMIDGCVHPPKRSYAEWTNFFRRNFERHYYNNKAPFGLYAHASWFYFPYQEDRLRAFTDFLDYLGTLNDVYIVTMSQLIAWSKNPTPLSQLNTFQPWSCAEAPPQTSCVHTDNVLCRYEVDHSSEENQPQSEVLLRLCASEECPSLYPNVSVPLGEIPPPSTTSMNVFSTEASSALVVTAPVVATTAVPTSLVATTELAASPSVSTDVFSTSVSLAATQSTSGVATAVAVTSTERVPNVGPEPTSAANPQGPGATVGVGGGPGRVDNNATTREGVNAAAAGAGRLGAGAVVGVVIGVLLIVGAITAVAIVGGVLLFKSRTSWFQASKRESAQAENTLTHSYRNPSSQPDQP